MTIEHYVICHRDRLPSPERFVAELKANGIDLAFDSAFDPRDCAGRFVPCKFEGLVSGFEFSGRPYEDDAFDFPEDEANRIGDRDTIVELSTYSNAQEIAGSSSVAAILTKLTDGVLVAEFEEGLILGSEALRWLRGSMPDIREQFDGPSKLRRYDVTDVPKVRVRLRKEG